MPIIKSAKKRVRVANKAAVRNSKTKRSLKNAVKSFHAAISGKSKNTASLSKAQSEIDKAVKKNVMHKNKAARKKAQLARAAKAAGVKSAASKKTTTKKPATKKASAKKSAAKKTTKK